jgi:CDP-glycerol glycerophosphotransferase
MKNKIKAFIISLSKKYPLVRLLLRKTVYIRRLLFMYIYYFKKVDSKLALFESYMGRSYACSPKAIYLEMLNNPKYHDYKFVWCFRDIDKYLPEFDSSRTTIVKYKSKQYYKAYEQAKYWFCNSRIPLEIKKKRNQIYVQCWHGTPFKRIGCDVIDNTQNAMNTKKEINKKYNIESDKFNYFISPSHYATSKFMTAFNMNNKSVKIIEKGYPRNDYLINYSNDDINKIKNMIGISTDKKIILYAPTWRDNEHNSNTGYTYKLDIDIDYLKKQLGNEYIILFRSHYLISNIINFDSYKDFVYDVSKTDDINELYIISDILITDYSSVFFDYANLKRPIIFYMYDAALYQNNLRGFYFDINELPGKVVNNTNEIITIIKNIDEYKQIYEKRYDKFNQKFNYLEDGKVTKRIVKEIIEEEMK